MTQPYNHQPEATTEVFLKNLRSATAPMHTALEANPVSASLMSPDLSLPAYRHYLTLMAEVVAFTEKVIFPAVSDIVPDTDQRRKLSQIHSDLTALTESTLEDPALFYPVDKDFTISFAMGYMYVTEGSTLGGRMILKHVQEKLGLNEAMGASFFAGYGSETGVKWKSFLSNLTNYAEQSGSSDEIIRGAQHAFAAIDRYFAAHSI